MNADVTHIAVLTGDLVNSTDLGPDQITRAFAALEDCARAQEDWMGAPLHFTRHRGDGWQVVLAQPRYALRAALSFRAALKALGDGFESYVGIATGQLNGPIAPDLNTHSARPFVVSGRALEIAKTSPHHINHANGGATEGMAILLDRISRGWTRTQAETMTHALHPENDPNHTEIAKVLAKSRQAVSKSLDAAWCDDVRYALVMLEAE